MTRRKIEARSKKIKIYLSEAEVRMVKRQAQDLGLSVPAYVRVLIHQDRGILHNEQI